jgi:predicted transcriptional regulator
MWYFEFRRIQLKSLHLAHKFSPQRRVFYMGRKIIEIASEIVQTQVSLAPMSSGEITSSLRQVFGTLLELQKAESGEIDLLQVQDASVTQEKASGAISPENSIQNDKVICLECGAEMKQLTQKHLISHGISSKEYKKKYGFPMRTPLAARALTKARSKAAKKRGLPANLVKAIEARRQSKVEGGEAAEEKKQPVVKRRRKPAGE